MCVSNGLLVRSWQTMFSQARVCEVQHLCVYVDLHRCRRCSPRITPAFEGHADAPSPHGDCVSDSRERMVS